LEIELTVGAGQSATEVTKAGFAAPTEVWVGQPLKNFPANVLAVDPEGVIMQVSGTSALRAPYGEDISIEVTDAGISIHLSPEPGYVSENDNAARVVIELGSFRYCSFEASLKAPP
jgi:hypothetical protein